MRIFVSIVLFSAMIFSLYRIIKEYKRYKTINGEILFWIAIMIVVFPTTIYYLDYFNIPSKYGWNKNMDSDIWLGNIILYGVTILSASIGAFVTIRSVKLSIEEQEKVRISENKKKALPLLRVKGEEEYDYRYKYIQFSCLFTEESKSRKRKDIVDTAKVTIRLDNVGMRELYDLWIGDIDGTYFFDENNSYHCMYPIIYKNDYVCINLLFYEMGNYDNDNWNGKFDSLITPMTFNCYFKDCYDNWYYQTLQISLGHHLAKNKGINEKALNIFVTDAQIISPPIEVEEKALPWNNGKPVCHH